MSKRKPEMQLPTKPNEWTELIMHKCIYHLSQFNISVGQLKACIEQCRPELTAYYRQEHAKIKALGNDSALENEAVRIGSDSGSSVFIPSVIIEILARVGNELPEALAELKQIEQEAEANQ